MAIVENMDPPKQSALETLRESLDQPIMDTREPEEVYVPTLEGDVQPFSLEGTPLAYPGLFTLGNRGGGSCFFHSIAQAFYAPYLEGYDSRRQVPFDPDAFVRQLRDDIARELQAPRVKTIEGSPSWFESLSRGALPSLSDTDLDGERVDLQTLQDLLRSDGSLGDSSAEIMIEMLSTILELDIYVIDTASGDVVQIDHELIYQGRPSCVLVHTPGHYELLVVGNSQNEYRTLFDTTDPFIERLKERLATAKTSP